jgi:hypothetical protein
MPDMLDIRSLASSTIRVVLVSFGRHLASLSNQRIWRQASLRVRVAIVSSASSGMLPETWRSISLLNGLVYGSVWNYARLRELLRFLLAFADYPGRSSFDVVVELEPLGRR